MDNAPKIDTNGEINADEMRQIINRSDGYKYPFPYATVNDHGGVYFSSKARPMIADARYCKVFTAKDLVIFQFTNDPDGAFKLRRLQKNGGAITAAGLRSRVKPGNYKLYRCSAGCAIKRHEPLNRKEE